MGKLVNSDRKFGVEIEFYAASPMSYRKIAEKLNVKRDGSLDGRDFGGEWVSDILQGEKGENVVREACAVLNKHNATTEDEKTSVHIHLDGRKPVINLTTSKKRPTDVPCVGLSNAFVRLVGPCQAEEIAERTFKYGAPPFLADAHLKKLDNVWYLSMGELRDAHPKMNYTYYSVADNEDRFDWLKNMFYFYTLFSDVLEGTVSNSRKFGNMYCIPLGSSFQLNAIASAKNEQELQDIWYKGNGQGGRYDNSRYHSFNLHSYWGRHGTFEVRCHGGTTDPDKILLWLRLHQKIADKLELMHFDDVRNLTGTAREFIDFLEEPLLQAYAKRLLGYFSGIKVK